MKNKRDRRGEETEFVRGNNNIGADAADATSGSCESAEEWADKQPLAEGPTYPLEPGDPSPLQPAAGTPCGQEEEEEGVEPRAKPAGKRS